MLSKSSHRSKDISFGTCQTIIKNNMHLKRSPAKFVPHLLTNEQKEHRKETCKNRVGMFNSDSHWLKNLITGDETWVYEYDPETKRQSSQWLEPREQRFKKARVIKSKLKCLLITFFDVKGLVHYEFVPEGQTINQHYYLDILRRLREAVRQKRPEKWHQKNWFFHHDNARRHSAVTESSLPLPQKESYQTMVALATQQNLIINTKYVKTAYLYDLADRVTELTSAPSSSTSTLEKELASLRAEISSPSRKSSPNSYRKYDSKGSWCWYHFRFKDHARKCIPPCTFNKRAKNQQENSNNNHFLFDTGAEISVLLPRPEDRRYGQTNFTLTAANNSPMKTYGERFLNLDLGLRRDFKWRFIIADTNKAILGADFMEHFGIISDIKGKFIIDYLTKLRKRASITNFNSLSPKCSINSYEDKFLNILSHYPSLTKPPSYSTPVKHSVIHHITKKGQPTFSKPRRLNPEKIKIAKS
ncbi:hypothetical protein LAZ67_23001230 [Cordylochernes scorpioides]|uniref:Transposase n=1 Tax=Cordylochernes scorpioides TaxID=51811 RepID=A0ABY6LUS9_9ARAC|nr:hypothetical protein LAZ67_23001230 [Cordylochernes scorpioides]